MVYDRCEPTTAHWCVTRDQWHVQCVLRGQDNIDVMQILNSFLCIRSTGTSTNEIFTDGQYYKDATFISTA